MRPKKRVAFAFATHPLGSSLRLLLKHVHSLSDGVCAIGVAKSPISDTLVGKWCSRRSVPCDRSSPACWRQRLDGKRRARAIETNDLGRVVIHHAGDGARASDAGPPTAIGRSTWLDAGSQSSPEPFAGAKQAVVMIGPLHICAQVQAQPARVKVLAHGAKTTAPFLTGW